MAEHEKVRTVTLVFRRPGADAIEHVDVPVYAAARGLVLHPPMNGLGEISELGVRTPYVLSAVPAGRSIARFRRPEDAQGAMDDLADLLDWSRVNSGADVPLKMTDAISSVLLGRNACWSMYDSSAEFYIERASERGRG